MVQNASTEFKSKFHSPTTMKIWGRLSMLKNLITGIQIIFSYSLAVPLSYLLVFYIYYKYNPQIERNKAFHKM